MNKRTKTVTARVTPEVKQYLKNSKFSVGDFLEIAVLNTISQDDSLIYNMKILEDRCKFYNQIKYHLNKKITETNMQLYNLEQKTFNTNPEQLDLHDIKNINNTVNKFIEILNRRKNSNSYDIDPITSEFISNYARLHGCTTEDLIKGLKEKSIDIKDLYK